MNVDINFNIKKMIIPFAGNVQNVVVYNISIFTITNGKIYNQITNQKIRWQKKNYQ